MIVLRFFKRYYDSTLKLESDSFNYASVYSSARNTIRNGHKRRYHLSRGLRCGSAAARLLGLRVRFQLGAWVFVFCERCVFSGRGYCGGPIPRPEDSYRVNVCVCVIEYDQADRKERLSQLSDYRLTQLTLPSYAFDVGRKCDAVNEHGLKKLCQFLFAKLEFH